jgi:peptide/nickel transport system substrate-binding protein
MGRFRDLAVAVGLATTLFMTAAPMVSYYEESLPSTMNPLFARTMVDRRTHELVFDRLFYRSPVTNELQSRIVTRFEKGDGGKSVTLWLKSGVKWHDGKPLTPGDVCFTIDAMLDEKTPSPVAKSYRDSISGCTADDKENSAKITFHKAYHSPRLRLSFSVLPKHRFDSTAISPDMEFSQRPVGTGAMKGAKGRSAVKFTAYPNSHQSARILEMSLAEGGDPFAQVTTLLSNGVQGVISVPPPLRPDVAGSDEVALKSYDLRSWWFIAVNTLRGPLQNKLVRKALDLTLDREQLRELTIGTEPGDENPPCEFVSGPFVQASPYYNRSVPVRPKADLPKAREMMTKAGASMQAERWVLGGSPVKFTIGMNAPLDTEAKDLLNQIGNQLAAGGFGRQVYKVTPDEWLNKVVTGGKKDFDLLIGKWSFGVVEDVNAMFHTRTGEKGTLNIFNYSNSEVDTLLGQYDQAKTDTEAHDAYHSLHEYLADDLPYIFLWKLDTKSAWRNEIRNNQVAPYYYFTVFEGWKIVEE